MKTNTRDCMDIKRVRKKDKDVVLFAESLIDYAFELVHAELTESYVLDACNSIIEKTQSFYAEQIYKLKA